MKRLQSCSGRIRAGSKGEVVRTHSHTQLPEHMSLHSCTVLSGDVYNEGFPKDSEQTLNVDIGSDHNPTTWYRLLAIIKCHDGVHLWST